MKLALIIFFLILLNLFIINVFFIEPFSLVLTKKHIAIPRLKETYKGLRIAHLSDIHIDRIGWFEKKIIRMTNDLTADYICITGDFIAYNQDFSDAIMFVNALTAKKGIILIFGNSDYTNMHSFYQALETQRFKEGVHLLRNEVYTTTYNDAPLTIGGIDDPITAHARPELVIPHMPAEGLRIILVHAYTDSLGNKLTNTDLVLAGHTHGGQIKFLPNALLLRIYRALRFKGMDIIDGLHQRNGRWVYVSRGIGMSLLPMRFMCKPEITLLTITE